MKLTVVLFLLVALTCSAGAFAKAAPIRILQAIHIRFLERRIATIQGRVGGATTAASVVPTAPSGITAEPSAITAQPSGITADSSGITSEPSVTTQSAAPPMVKRKISTTVPPPSAALVALAAEEGLSLADLLALPPDQLSELEMLAAQAGL